MFFGKDVYSAHPLLTEDTGVQGKGGWQLEVNGERTRDPLEGAPPRQATQAGMTLTYGATDTVDLKADLPYVHNEGALDLALGAKWRFYERGPLSFAVLAGVFLPTGDDEKGLGAGRANAGAAGVVSWIGERWEFHGHAGGRSNRNTLGERDSLAHLSAAVLYRLFQPLRLLVDTARDTNPDPATSTPLRQTVYGVIWSPTKDLDFDAGIRTGNGPAVDTALLLGFTLRW